MNVEPKKARIPLAVKLAYTAFVAVLVPYYWNAYGPTNFLYFCDVALLMAVVAMWKEDSLLASMPTVGILISQTIWCADFFGSLVGMPITGMTAYMFNENLSLFTRGLSFFHCWLPFLLLWMVWRLGYDRRAYLYWTILAWALMLVCYFLMPAPPAPNENPNLPVNINYVYGFSDDKPQSWMDPRLFFAMMMVALPVCLWPADWLLKKMFRPPT
jgi:hypothetical protein